MNEIVPMPGEQICRKSCPFSTYVDSDPDPNPAFLNEVGLNWFQAKEIIGEDGGIIGYCKFLPGRFVVLGLPCQASHAYLGAIAGAN